MTRQEKFSDTSTFHYYNANPHNRITGDCVTRALCTALEIPYNQCVMEQAEMQCITGFDNADTKGIAKYLEAKGWKKQPQPRKKDGTKYTGKEWCKWLNENDNRNKRIVCNIGGHHTVCIVKDFEFKVYDIWDSTSGCIGNYWIKG